MHILQVLNTKGAARKLGCTSTWIHKLVSAGKLKAYVYGDSGVLVEHKPEQKRQGQGLYFFIDDIEKYQSSVPQRPGRSRSKNRGTATVKGEQAQNGNPF